MFEKIKRVGLAQSIDDLFGNQFSYYKFLYHKSINKPYFGAYLASTQGKSVRHFYMQELVKKYFNGKEINILEIGSWAGGSVLTWCEAIDDAKANGRVFCIDPWVDYLGDNSMWVHKTMKKAVKKNRIFKLFWHNILSSGHSDKVSILRGSTEDMHKFLAKNSFDLIFIDANHSYSYVKKDLDLLIPLLKDGGILCGDDLELQFNEVNSEDVYQNRETDVIKDTKRGINFHPGVTLAVYETFGRYISCFKGFWAVQKSDGWIDTYLDTQKTEVLPKHLQ